MEMTSKHKAVYVIRGSYRGGPLKEPIDEAENPVEANEMLQEYRMAFGKEWELTIVREERDQ
jgi:hypothetical protein